MREAPRAHMFESVQWVLDAAVRSVRASGEPAWAVLGSALLLAVLVSTAISGALAPGLARIRRSLPGVALAFPLLAAGAFVPFAFIVDEAFSHAAPVEPLRVEMTARESWWEVRYGQSGRRGVLANELRVPQGRPVQLTVTNADSSVSRLTVGALALDAELAPGSSARLFVAASGRGVYAAEGSVLTVIAESDEDFEEWLARQAAPSVMPTDPLLQNGRDALFRAGCDRCHGIRGTAALGRSGPDLTHVGSRRSLASDAVERHLLARTRPRDRSAAGAALQSLELRAIAAYLSSLK